MARSIEQLLAQVGELPPGERQVFSRIFSVDVVKSILCPPDAMLPWIERQFGSLEKVREQTVVKVTNLITLEQSLFNPLRSLRPRKFGRLNTNGMPAARQGPDIFSDPLEHTTANAFGRVEGKYCVTAGNVASCEQYHCVIIFNNADPLDFGYKEVADYLDTGWRWMLAAHNYDPAARYGLFLWNCNSRAGASIPHGHAQVVLGRGSHYARIEHLRKAAGDYKSSYGNSYFHDLFEMHNILGLGFTAGDTKVMACLSPLKLNEVMILADSLSDFTKEAVYRVLACFRDRLNTTSFNLGIVFPPIGSGQGWEGFPVIIRMLDRGDAGEISSDISAMEFWGANVISSDPFKTASALREAFKTA
jgi:hypothetical protein